jgi:hypothetical protein
VEKINRRIYNSFRFYQILKGILWKREIPKQYKTTIYNLYFKLILTHTEHQNMDTYKERQKQNESNGHESSEG